MIRTTNIETGFPEPSGLGSIQPTPQVLGANARSSQRSGTVLVVDDSAFFREVERCILEEAGYAVQTAVDGVDALARLTEVQCRLVLTDIEMPRMDGFALTEAIRAAATLATLPIVIITSHDSEESRRRGFDAGADGYVVKSAFNEKALLDAVEQFLGGRR